MISYYNLGNNLWFLHFGWWISHKILGYLILTMQLGSGSNPLLDPFWSHDTNIFDRTHEEKYWSSFQISLLMDGLLSSPMPVVLVPLFSMGFLLPEIDTGFHSYRSIIYYVRTSIRVIEQWTLNARMIFLGGSSLFLVSLTAVHCLSTCSTSEHTPPRNANSQKRPNHVSKGTTE